MKTLVIYGHPDYKNSFANKTILEEFSKIQTEAEIRNISELYPDWNIDVKKEQAKLAEADVIIFEFPFWWYSSPSIVHRYLEQVFVYGFAYGTGGNALQGKRCVISFTTGGDREAYTKEGYQHYDIEDFLPQFKAMVNLTGMVLVDTIISYGMALVGADENKVKTVEKEAREHGKKLAQATIQK